MFIKNIQKYVFSTLIKTYELKSIGYKTITNTQPLNTAFNIGTDVPK